MGSRFDENLPWSLFNRPHGSLDMEEVITSTYFDDI